MKLRLIAVSAVLICFFCSMARIPYETIPNPGSLTRGLEEPVYMHAVLTEAGTLADVLGDNAMKIDSVSIVGPVNEADFYALWKSSFYGRLKVINMEQVKIENNRIPDNAFFHFDEQKDLSTSIVMIKVILLRRIILPEGLAEIGESAFSYAISLNEINFPSSLKCIGEQAFYHCVGLTADALGFNDGLETIGEYAFSDCYFLEGRLRLPSSLRIIDEGAFHMCHPTDIDIPESLRYLGMAAFWGGQFSKAILPDGCELSQMGSQFYSNWNLEEVRLPADLTYIPERIFDACSNLNSIEIPSGTVYIGEGAFTETALTEIALPDRVESIGMNSFQSCRMLEKITLPASLRVIGRNAFGDCRSMVCIYSKSLLPPHCINELEYLDFISPFSGFPHDIPVYVPVGSADLYRNAPGWDYLTNFIETEFPGSSVDAVSVDSSCQDVLYDLSGRRITVPASCQPYILNGRKHIRK